MIALLAGVGLLVGAGLPLLIARIPDREPAGSGPPDGERPVTPYRELASGRMLPAALAVTTAGAWALVGLARADLGAATAAYLLVATLGVAMTYVDVREHRLPDWLTLPAFAGAAVALGVVAAVSGEWGPYGRAWAAAAASLVFYLTLALLRPSDLGLGDVKLGVVLGFLLGWIGWPVLVLGVFAAFVVGAVVGLALMIVGNAGRRSAIPFGPPMLAGALVAVVWGQPIVDAYLGL